MPRETIMYKKNIYPTDFSKNAEKAFEYVKKLKDAGTREVVILLFQY